MFRAPVRSIQGAVHQSKAPPIRRSTALLPQSAALGKVCQVNESAIGLRERSAKPIAPKPATIISHVPGSGVSLVTGTRVRSAVPDPAVLGVEKLTRAIVPPSAATNPPSV